MTVDTTTGEIVPVDTSSAVAVTSYLEAARHWLATAVDETGPDQIARAKAELATAAEATRQLDLSREIRDDAKEMVRRAEYALGKSIRKGQAEGTINRHGNGGARGNQYTGGEVVGTATSPKSSPYDFAKHTDLYGDGKEGGNGAYAMADNAETDEDFEKALSEARNEGNLSRANVVRKVKERTKPRGSEPEKRPEPEKRSEPAQTEWSRRVQNVSAEIDMNKLSDDQVRTLQGAAEFLMNYCRGELKIREANK